MDQYQITITTVPNETRDKTEIINELKVICQIISKNFVISEDLVITHNNPNDVNYEKNFKLLEEFLQLRYKNHYNVVLSIIN